MTQPPNGFDPNDPIGTWRAWRDATLDAWAKSMTALVNTETFSQAIGAQLDALLAVSGPVQQAVQQYMERYLAQAQLPSRNEVVTLASRLTNIEFRLDDMQAQLDELTDLVRKLTSSETQPAPDLTMIGERLQVIEEQLTSLSVVRAANRPRKATTEEKE
jgi:polyhydroxyalkanoic acid synthase PhaR subunit